MREFIKVIIVFLLFLITTLFIFYFFINLACDSSSYDKGYKDGIEHQYKVDIQTIKSFMNKDDYYNYLSIQQVNDTLLPIYKNELIEIGNEIINKKK